MPTVVVATVAAVAVRVHAWSVHRRACSPTSLHVRLARTRTRLPAPVRAPVCCRGCPGIKRSSQLRLGDDDPQSAVIVLHRFSTRFSRQHRLTGAWSLPPPAIRATPQPTFRDLASSPEGAVPRPECVPEPATAGRPPARRPHRRRRYRLPTTSPPPPPQPRPQPSGDREHYIATIAGSVRRCCGYDRAANCERYRLC